MILGLYTKLYGNLGSLSLCCIYYLGEIHADAHRIEGLVRNLLISERLSGLDVLRITYTEHARRKTVTVSELSCTGVFRSQLTSGWQASNLSNFENPHYSGGSYPTKNGNMSESTMRISVHQPCFWVLSQQDFVNVELWLLLLSIEIAMENGQMVHIWMICL